MKMSATRTTTERERESESHYAIMHGMAFLPPVRCLDGPPTTLNASLDPSPGAPVAGAAAGPAAAATSELDSAWALSLLTEPVTRALEVT